MFTTVRKAYYFLLLPALSGVASAGLVPQHERSSTGRANNVICGQKGYDGGKGNYFYDDSGNLATYTACAAQCAASAQCQSFGFGEQVCMLFSIRLSGNFDSDPKSPDMYYDQACPPPSSPPSSAAASSPVSPERTSPTASTKTSVQSARSMTSLPSSKQTTLSGLQAPKGSSSPFSFSPSSAAVTKSTAVVTSSNTAVSSQAASSKASTNSKASTSSKASISFKASTSSKKATSKTINTTATYASTTTASVTGPTGCSAPATISMTSFRWFNSTNNLDCAARNYPSDAQVCWDGSNNTVCAGPAEGCICTPYCYTGLPSAAYQPLGWGPPDTVSITLQSASESSSLSSSPSSSSSSSSSSSVLGACSAANPQSFRNNELGGGHFDCGSAADIIGFYADSDPAAVAAKKLASVYFNNYNANSGAGGCVPRYEAAFPITCSYDAGGNATCSAPTPVTLSLAKWL